MPASIPTATYRFQFNKEFTFRDARALVPYLHDLGISHVYASPIFRAMPGSMHGYDICDHNALNPEIGTREDFDALIAELHRLKLGLIVDFVPNHMGIAETQNHWWMDVLENGPASPYARFFDIDWVPLKRELENKVLLPVLGDQYGRVLEQGDLKVRFEGGRFWLDYYALRLPLGPRSTRPLLKRAAELLAEPPVELMSILTAIEHLPASTETDHDKVVERMREKDVIRNRLNRLCEETPAVLDAIKRALTELQDASDPTSFDRLDALISNQPYRLSSWKVAAEEINYRRFFDVNSLAAIRMELPEVFDATHKLLFQLIGSHAVDGVRIDHIDGLADPREYLRTLQTGASGTLGVPAEKHAIYLLVEKILGSGEKLRADWPVHGTTGYEFANQVTELLVDRTAERTMTDTYNRFVGRQLGFQELVYRSKKLVMQVSMASEVNVLGHLLNRLSESHRWYRDFTVNALTAAVRETIACFRVYRTYLVPGETPAEACVRIIYRALAEARRRNPALERTVFEFLRAVLLPPDPNPHQLDETLRREFVLKFQQCTSPIAAKGVEDTAFYQYHRLIALNEVGGEPGEFGATVETFHRQNAARLAEFPHSMLATSTHDTKRSEDVRARLTVLSEMPKEWGRALRRWHTVNRKFRGKIDNEWAPDHNEETLLYQTLLGSWPLEPLNAQTRPVYVKRIQDYMVKALHEAKVNSSWVEPNVEWDKAVCDFVAKVLAPHSGNRFLSTFQPFAERLAAAGAINSLSQTLLKLTVPGMPDFYQGSELWDFSLVDPDNRRPVDYEQCRTALTAISGEVSPRSLLEHWRDGRIKSYLIRTLLHFRRDHPQLFAEGSYRPISVSGALADCVVAFERQFSGMTLLVVVPRLVSQLGFPPLGDRWEDTAVEPSVSRDWCDLISGQKFPSNSSLPLARILSDFPAAALLSKA
ncbi:malto-oligosyltrehalose synthase [Chthoniobacter flavus Ellin428]|uniref:Malto-oligosyltrehalose synthase n=1 Tax=Chthoniobacter flavus Ellin428 TaxID=497964 RepID=B4CZ67_9BACT|nr:malto-oligosyltrehalose synthase [Chthoniobacter flavus]EDY20758.1 malto-oligosyltrehalose synthase [Chthoniobacter flavus Ellin428]TCO89652.1 maltooligosyl trehalose synthase [Chthoniobacter flavus]